jgi:cation:H+ antiporter
MVINFLIFLISLFLVIHGATLATKYSAKVAKSLGLSKYAIGFIVVALISILPEALVSINAAVAGMPALGFGTLIGSNIADLTIVFSILVVLTGRSIKIESRLLKHLSIYPLFLFIPIIFGLNAHYSRLEGVFLIAVGLLFYYMIFNGSVDVGDKIEKGHKKFKNMAFLLFSVVLLLVGTYFVVDTTSSLATFLKISPILVGLLVVGLGTTIPELFFSYKALEAKEDGLAAGDILGTVLADATIVIGILAFISPFNFPIQLVYLSGLVMVLAAFILFNFMRSGRAITKKEAYLMAAFWFLYVIIEFFLNI